mgnify:CR=1 FL=1
MFKIEQTQKKRPWLSFLLSSSAKKLVPLALIGGSLLMLPAVHAGRHLENLPRGFDNYYNNILAIQSQGRDDEDVCLRGRLTSYLQDDCYEFTDEMGNSIEVELDDDVNWGLVSKDQLIEIFGDIDRNMFRVKIDAKGFNILEETVPPEGNVAVAAASAPAPAVASATAAQSTTAAQGATAVPAAAASLAPASSAAPAPAAIPAAASALVPAQRQTVVADSASAAQSAEGSGNAAEQVASDAQPEQK